MTTDITLEDIMNEYNNVAPDDMYLNNDSFVVGSVGLADFQGDVGFTPIDSLPSGVDLKEEAPNEKGHLVVTHSETGHHHVIDLPKYSKKVSEGQTLSPAARLLVDKTNEFCAYLEVNNPEGVTLEHLRSNDTHKPFFFKQGIFRIHRQREYTPEGIRRAQD